MLAVNPETLKAQGSLFGGKVTGGDFKKAMPACCLGLKVSGVDALIAAGEAEAKKALPQPQVPSTGRVEPNRIDQLPASRSETYSHTSAGFSPSPL